MAFVGSAQLEVRDVLSVFVRIWTVTVNLNNNNSLHRHCAVRYLLSIMHVCTTTRSIEARNILR